MVGGLAAGPCTSDIKRRTGWIKSFSTVQWFKTTVFFLVCKILDEAG